MGCLFALVMTVLVIAAMRYYAKDGSVPLWHLSGMMPLGGMLLHCYTADDDPSSSVVTDPDPPPRASPPKSMKLRMLAARLANGCAVSEVVYGRAAWCRVSDTGPDLPIEAVRGCYLRVTNDPGRQLGYIIECLPAPSLRDYGAQEGPFVVHLFFVSAGDVVEVGEHTVQLGAVQAGELLDRIPLPDITVARHSLPRRLVSRRRTEIFVMLALAELINDLKV